MPIRKSKARWEGGLKSGNGKVAVGMAGQEMPYSFASRFEEGNGTNPEELIGSAHAGCFSMAFAARLEKEGFQPRKVETEARVHLDKVETGFKISAIELVTQADVPGIDAARFQQIAEDAKKNCPVSQALSALEIRLDAKLA